MSKHVFVFGSNLAGIHGKGAARDAVKFHGAMMGNPVGRQGSSYAIPTKDTRLRPLPLEKIAGYVEDFKKYAREHPETEFFVTAIGTGLAGYSVGEIAPMFKDCPRNCGLPREFGGINPIYEGRTNV
jgi:hypothetical protein